MGLERENSEAWGLSHVCGSMFLLWFSGLCCLGFWCWVVLCHCWFSWIFQSCWFLKFSYVICNSVSFSKFLGYVICPSMFFWGIMSTYVVSRYYKLYWKNKKSNQRDFQTNPPVSLRASFRFTNGFSRCKYGKIVLVVLLLLRYPLEIISMSFLQIGGV